MPQDQIAATNAWPASTSQLHRHLPDRIGTPGERPTSSITSTGSLVTAQIWYLKIWAKFSLFALHCIMAYIFELLN